MNFLVIDTTRKEAVLELYYNGVNFSQTIMSQKRHNENLLQSIEEILKKAKTSIKQIDAFGCVTGPGSFTGIRVGMATIIAFSLANQKPIVSANVFEILAGYVKEGTILLYSTSSSYYYAHIKESKIESYGIVSSDKIDEFLKKCNKVYCLQSEQQLMNFSYNNIETINNYNYLLYEFFKNQTYLKNFTRLQNFEPFYVQESQAERELKLKSEKNDNGNKS